MAMEAALAAIFVVEANARRDHRQYFCDAVLLGVIAFCLRRTFVSPHCFRVSFLGVNQNIPIVFE